MQASATDVLELCDLVEEGLGDPAEFVAQASAIMELVDELREAYGRE